ncbi:hypothetical protein KUC_1800 [Vreelandella boliviensis LC1]|uniref:Uncharacterized protein n=1 Tax=Vreelandella boliviensis LC1 TaxID=1072583 RepID=A0A7U9C830_9GAMM|nr:hypothetical protein KUC_1800 [Halomonas boliviensis LC1]
MLIESINARQVALSWDQEDTSGTMLAQLLDQDLAPVTGREGGVAHVRGLFGRMVKEDRGGTSRCSGSTWRVSTTQRARKPHWRDQTWSASNPCVSGHGPSMARTPASRQLLRKRWRKGASAALRSSAESPRTRARSPVPSSAAAMRGLARSKSSARSTPKRLSRVGTMAVAPRGMPQRLSSPSSADARASNWLASSTWGKKTAAGAPPISDVSSCRPPLSRALIRAMGKHPFCRQLSATSANA